VIGFEREKNGEVSGKIRKKKKKKGGGGEAIKSIANMGMTGNGQ
jgi:hypothetical protein